MVRQLACEIDDMGSRLMFLQLRAYVKALSIRLLISLFWNCNCNFLCATVASFVNFIQSEAIRAGQWMFLEIRESEIHAFRLEKSTVTLAYTVTSVIQI